MRIWYPSTHGADQAVLERIVSPYFIEPNPGGHTRYLIGHDSHSGQVRTFRIERVQQAELTDEHFTIPADFDAADRLRDAWGISDEDLVQVRLRFHDPLLPLERAKATGTRLSAKRRTRTEPST